MLAQTKIILLILTLFLSCYSQESSKSVLSDEVRKFTLSSTHSGIDEMKSPRSPDISGDTIRLFHNETYALFSGAFQEIKYLSRVYREIKMNSVIRGNVDIPINSIIGISNFRNRCPDDAFELNKDYLMLNVIIYGKTSIIPQRKKCEDYLILPDTPENREKLIKKYEEKIIIYEPKPAEK